MAVDFSGRHPLTEAIYRLRFDDMGGVVKSYRQIAASLSTHTETITTSQVSGIMARNRDLFPKDDKEPPREYSTNQRAIDARVYYQRKKQQGAKKSKVAEIADSGENKLYIDGSNGKNPPRQWQRTQRTDDPKQKDFLLGEKLSSDFLTSNKVWQINEGVGIRGKSLVDIGIRECRYVVDDTEGNMLMCGEHAATYPYCSKHAKYSYRPSGAIRI